jgi:hypothetical protein
MGQSWTHSIVPNGLDETVYLAVDCVGEDGCIYRETNVGQTDLETVIIDLMSGQYSDPDRVAAFNTADKWTQNVSDDIAREIRRRADPACEDLSSSIEDFVVQHAAREKQLSLRPVSHDR